MKTREFVEKVERLGFNASERGEEKIVVLFGVREVATVSTCEMYAMNTSWWTFYDLDLPVRRKLFELLVEYAETPIHEREEERRYLIEFPKGFHAIEDGNVYLNKRLYEENTHFLGNKDYIDGYQTKFTDSEIAKLPECYKLAIDCKFAKKVEVE